MASLPNQLLYRLAAAFHALLHLLHSAQEILLLDQLSLYSFKTDPLLMNFSPFSFLLFFHQSELFAQGCGFHFFPRQCFLNQEQLMRHFIVLLRRYFYV